MAKTSVLVLFALVALVSGRSMNHQQKRTNLFQQIKRGPPPPPPPPVGSESNPSPFASEELWMTQKVDHFDPLDTRTWQQRYFLSRDTYQAGGPVFLYLSGEWEASGSQVTDRFIGEMAAEYGALMINLEHRFYGKSQPTPDASTENLRYLNADQALEDAAVFTMALMADPELDLSGPWIVFGGSYSANLAAWARARYPHLFYAAHASSGPVLAQLDFTEYYEVVNEALLSVSSACPGYVTAAMEELFVLVEQVDSETISTLFNLCEVTDISNKDDEQYIYMLIAEYFAGEVQYGRSGNLDKLCNTLEAGQDKPLETMATLVRDGYGNQCMSSHYQDVLDHYRDTVEFSSDIAREWYYQTCMEYGYYQTLSSVDQPFGQIVPIEFHLKWCTGVYGPEYNRNVTEAGIARTNLVNGGLNPDVTRVLYTHGTLDPWHAIGIQSDLNSESPVIMIEGASHCRDLSAAAADDAQEIIDARIQISKIIGDWVQQARDIKKKSIF